MEPPLPECTEPISNLTLLCIRLHFAQPFPRQLDPALPAAQIAAAAPVPAITLTGGSIATEMVFGAGYGLEAATTTEQVFGADYALAADSGRLLRQQITARLTGAADGLPDLPLLLEAGSIQVDAGGYCNAALETRETDALLDGIIARPGGQLVVALVDKHLLGDLQTDLFTDSRPQFTAGGILTWSGSGQGPVPSAASPTLTLQEVTAISRSGGQIAAVDAAGIPGCWVGDTLTLGADSFVIGAILYRLTGISQSARLQAA